MPARTAKKAGTRASSATKAAKVLRSGGKPKANATSKSAAKSAAKPTSTEAKPAQATSPTARTKGRKAATGKLVSPARAPAGTLVREVGSPSLPSPIERAVRRYRELLRSADEPLREQLMEAVTAGSTPDAGTAEVDEASWGPAPSAARVAVAELEQLHARFDDRRQLAAHSITRDDAARLLNISGQAVTDHLRDRDLTGFKEGRRWLIPSWQFDPDSERGFLSGIAAVASVFPGGVVSLSRWMARPNPDFDDRTPREELTAGRINEVVAAAAALTAAGW